MALALAAAALLLAGCGTGRSTSSSSAAGSEPPPAARPFAWLRRAAPPPGWPTVRIEAGATMAYPAGWTTIHGDPGTASVALFGPAHRYLGYLNLTPKQGPETVANWGRFRVSHNAEEGDKRVIPLATATARRLGAATESCVEDAYTTTTDAKYVEIACIIDGRAGTVVAVGATPPQEFGRIAPLLERAIASVTA